MPYDFEYFTEEHVRGVLSLHPAECVFELDAPKNIVQRLSVRTADEWYKLMFDKNNVFEIGRQGHKEFKACWTASEIYCPHEGIDKLAECGVKTLDWETA